MNSIPRIEITPQNAELLAGFVKPYSKAYLVVTRHFKLKALDHIFYICAECDIKINNIALGIGDIEYIVEVERGK